MDWRWTWFSLDLELTTRCGLGCAFCPHACLTRPTGDMSQSTSEVILERVAPFRPRIACSGMGNPLAHPTWDRFLARARELGVPAGMVIPATSLTEELIDRLGEAVPAFLEISLPSLRPEVFARLQPGQDLPRALRLLDLLTEKFRGLPCPLVPTGLQTGLNVDEEPDFLAWWRDRGLHARFNACHRRGGALTQADLVTARILPPGPCGLFARHSFVCWNGDVLACCHDLTGATRLGNVCEETAETIGLRRTALAERIATFALCTACDEPRKIWPLPDGPFPETPRSRRRHLSGLQRKMRQTPRSGRG